MTFSMNANTNMAHLTSNSTSPTENSHESIPHRDQDDTAATSAAALLPQPSPKTDMDGVSTEIEHFPLSGPIATGSNTTERPQSSTSTTRDSESTAVPSSATAALANLDTTLQTNNPDLDGEEEVDASDSEEESLLGECTTEEREFVAVEGYRSEANKKFNGTAGAWGQILARDDSRFHPRQPLKRWDSVSLRVAVVGGDVAPHLNLRAIVGNDRERSTVHVGQLNFYSGSVHGMGAQIVKLELSREASEGKQTNGDFDGSYLCKFYTHGGVPSSLWLPSSKHLTYDPDTSSTFRLLQGLTNHAVTDSGAGMMQVVLKVRAKVGQHEDNEALWAALQTLTSTPVRPWHQYLHPSGLPECQFGSMVKRSIIARDIPLIRYPAQNFFIDVVEAEVKLAYCAALEYDWKQVMLESLQMETHGVSFVHVGRKMILALVKVNGQYTPNGDRITIDPGTYFKLQWKATGHSKLQIAVGVTIENWLGLPDIDLMLMVHKKPTSFLDVDPAMAGAWDTGTLPGPFRLDLKPVANKADVRRQISAVHTLCNTTLSDHQRWWPLLLNQDVRHLPAQTVAQMDGVDATMMKEACKVADGLLPWNKQQKKILCDGGKFYGGACLFEGPPGTGKTKVLAALALIYLLCDFHVLLVAPTKAAADNEATDLMNFLHRVGCSERFEPIRVYRPLAEQRGLQERPDANEYDLPTDDPDSQLLELLLEMKKELGRREFNLPNISLQARTAQRARQRREGDILSAAYPPDPDSPPIANFEPLPEVDMWAEFRRHLDLLEQTPLREWTPEERRKFRCSWKCCRDLVVSEARCLITTDSTAACEFVRGKFGGENPKGIFILQDEAANESEARTWIPVVKLTNGAHVKGLVMVGDVNQLPPCFLTANEKYNEFVEQGLASLYKRLLAEGFPSIRLTTQYRMHPLISWFPNRRTYQGKLLDAETTHTRARDTNFDHFVSNHLSASQQTKTGNQPILACLNVVDGICQMDANSPSKLNVPNINVVMSLLLSYWKGSEGKAQRNITVIVPYRAQKALYVQRMLLASKALKIQPANLAKVVTVDGFQGKEADIIILDTVVTDKLGFLEVEERMNVACTRAKDNLIMVAKMGITAEARFTDWKDEKGTETGIRVPNPKPFLIAYLEYLQSSNRVFTYTGAKHSEASFEPKASTQTPQPDTAEKMDDYNSGDVSNLDQGSGQSEPMLSGSELQGWGKSDKWSRNEPGDGSWGKSNEPTQERVGW